MKRTIILFGVLLLAVSCNPSVKYDTDNNQEKTEKKYQSKTPPTQPFGQEAFVKLENTEIRWLGMAGFLVNSRGTTLMIDPLLGGFDMPVIIDFPIEGKQVPRLDAILITHSDNDHYSISTNADLKSVTREYHSTVLCGFHYEK